MSLRNALLLSLALLSLAACAVYAQSPRTTRVPYQGWANCIKLDNGTVELIATLDVGPRIMRFGFAGERNEFWENEPDLGQTGGDEWRIYGGHRLWHSPETKPRTYYPDNAPIECIVARDGVRLVQPTEETTGIQKEIELRMSPTAAHVEVIHRLTNRGLWPIELAVWALTPMAPGGIAVIPVPTGDRDPFGLLPNRTIALWPYTDMTDERVTWGKEYVLLRQSSTAGRPFKVGVSADDGWIAYVRDDICFVKTFEYKRGAVYPDGGSSVESWTSSDPNMLEVETVGPLTLLQPGETVEHVENWYLFRGVAAGDSEAWADRHVRPLAEASVEGKVR